MSNILKLSEYRGRPCWLRAHERAKLKLPLLAGIIQDKHLGIPVRIELTRNRLVVRVPRDHDHLIAFDTLKVMGDITGLDIKIDHIPMWQVLFMEYKVLYGSSL